MKGKRLLSCALALAMTLSLTAVTASAATAFPDIQSHWAKSYIEEMTDANMFKGYEDGTFKPENKLTAAEALALCARAVGLDDNTAAKIADDRKEDVDSILDGAQSWFYKEFAICLETGILSYSDLKVLFQSGQLVKPIEKEDLAVYLVRAMQLGPMAERLTVYDMGFTDVTAISPSAKPYVYLLNNYGIVQGDEKNAFSPNLEVSRAVMATMLSRSLAFMEKNGIEADLPEYTKYDYAQGAIAAVSNGSNGITLLTLNNDLTGLTDTSVSLPADVSVYENNMLTSTNALKAGRHARIIYNSKGVAEAVRVSSPLEVYSGTVNGIDEDDIAVTADGQGMIFTMDRFTQVQVGSKSMGDRTIVDPDAGYTNAVCMVDDQGRLVAVRFTGGTRQEEGIFSSLEKATGTSTSNTVRVMGFDGVNRSYSMPTAAIVTVNGLSGSLNNTYEGSYVSMRVSNEDNTVMSVALDYVTKYIQGGVKGVSYASDTNTLTIQPLGSNKSTTYNVAKSCVITYNGETTLLKNIQKDSFVTVRLSGSELVRIDAYPGSTVTEGVITGRSINTNDASIIIQVTQEDETVVSFTMSLSDAPTVERNGEKSSVDKLKVGDQVEVTVRYNEVTKVIATPQTANVIATINSILQTTSGYTLNLTLSTGEEAAYPVASGISVTQAGKEVDVSTLKPGYRVGLVLNGDQVTSIEVQQAVNQANKLNGTVLYVNSSNSDKYVLLKVVDELGQENSIRVNVTSRTTILSASNGDSVYFKDLAVGDVLEVTGTAKSGSEFDATIIIRS